MAEKRLQTPKGRLSFPFIFKPRPAEKPGDKEKFSLSLIFDEAAQKTPEWEAIKAEVRSVAVAKFGQEKLVNPETGKPDVDPKKNTKKAVIVPKAIKNPIRSGDEKELDGYGPGTVFISATSERAPGVVGGDLKPVDDKGCYAGCYARATVTVYAYDRPDSKGVTFGLRNVQKMADGDPFGGGGDPTKDFAAVEGYQSSGAAQDFAKAPASAAASAAGSSDDDIPF